MRLLALVDSPNHVCCRYRIKAFEAPLLTRGWTLTCEALPSGALARLRQIRSCSDYDAVLLQRKLLPSWQVALLRRYSRHLVFDFDDAVLFRDSYSSRGTSSRRREARFGRIVRMADTVIAGNDFLADCALRAGATAEKVRTIPTCVEPARYPKNRRTATDGLPPELVWIGSSSTLKGLEERRSLWEGLGSRFPGLKLRIVCDRFPNFDNIEVIPTPWSEETEADDLALGHVGIGVMPDDDWSRGKCGLKILQYQAAGLPVIANPVGSHVEMIEPGVTGCLVTSDEEWRVAIQTMADPETRSRMGSTARRRVEASYSVAAWSEAFAVAATGAERIVRSASGSIEGANSAVFEGPRFFRETSRAVGATQATPPNRETSRLGRLGSE